MTPKEKAKELIKKYYGNTTDFIDSNKEAKEAAIVFSIVCVEEKIKTLYDICGENSVFHTSKEKDILDELIDLKEELERL